MAGKPAISDEAETTAASAPRPAVRSRQRSANPRRGGEGAARAVVAREEPAATGATKPLLPASLEYIGKLLTVVGVLVPVTGAFTREVAFSLNGHVPLGVGAALPIPQLAVMGAGVTGPALVLGLIFGWGLKHVSPMAFPSPPIVRGVSRRRVLFNVALYGALLLGLVYILATIGAGLLRDLTKSPSALVSGSAAVATTTWASWRARNGEPIPFSRMIPAVLLIAVTSGLTVSFGPTTLNVSVAQVTFVDGAVLASGSYSLLSDDGTHAWLLSCAPGSLAVRVPSGSIAAAQVVGYGAAPAPASWASVPGVGFVQRCP